MRFHNDLFVKCFTLQMDHKPLISLFNEPKGVPSQALGRMAKMKTVACLFFWWPGMDTKIEGLARKAERTLVQDSS